MPPAYHRPGGFSFALACRSLNPEELATNFAHGGASAAANSTRTAIPGQICGRESPSDRNKLSDPELYLESHQDKLVILDEIHRFPELFAILRGLIDRGRWQGRKTGRFLLLEPVYDLCIKVILTQRKSDETFLPK